MSSTVPPTVPPAVPSSGPVRLRPVTDDDRADVLALNQAEVEMLAPMDDARCDRLRGLAHRFDVVEVGGAFAGFLITVAPGSAYDSENYRWFGDRYGTDFYYLDRFVLRADQRRRGLGSRVYDEVEPVAAAYGRMVLEVNLVPRNGASLAFHDRRGYVEVGRLGTPTGEDAHLVSLREKKMSS